MSRHEPIDALRGVALFGIMFGNATWFSGTAVRSPAARAELGTATADAITRWLVHVFVDGKFYSLFALLFGVGFGLAMHHAPLASARFRRRMSVLLVLGGLHATLLWFGDIVSLYAVTGSVLPWCWRWSDRALLRGGVTLLLAPIALSLLAFALGGDPAGGDPGHGPAALLPAFATGSYRELLAANWAFVTERWTLAFQSGRFCKLLGLFLLGAWSVRRGIALDPAAHQPFLRRLSATCAAIGIPANIALAWFLANVPERPPSLLGCARAGVYAVAAPTLCFAYASALTLFWCKHAPLRSAFAIAGRLSFSLYIGHSLLGVAVFYGVGCGLWGRWGEAAVAAALPLVFAVQVALGAIWLRRVGAGPIETLVRRFGPLTDRRPNASNVATASGR